LDLSFAKVNLADARLLAIRARNERDSAFADLGAAMGLAQAEQYELAEEPLPADLPPSVTPLIQEAMVRRPELAGIRLEEEAAQRFATAEKGLRNPTISALAAAGGTPAHDDRLTGRYAAAGVTVNIPIFNGHLFSARRTEAELRAQALTQRRRDFENLIARDVRIAWLNAATAFQRLDATRQLLEQAVLSLELAQARYDLGLSSIIELSQAQLNRTAAEIGDSSARYDYQIQRAVLRYLQGTLR
jgi:outer membrane protein